MPLSSFTVQNFKKSLKCIWSFEDAISIQIEGIKSPWDIFGLEVVRIFYLLGHTLGFSVLGHFGLKNQTKFRKILNYILFSFHEQNCYTIFPKYILFIKRIETFWSRDIRKF